MTHSIEYRRILTRMGYYNYQNGLIYRHLNQEGGWDSHLDRCRTFILKALDFYKPEKVTVFGSGWLLDIPIAEMAEKTGKICLVDIVHPPDVISQVRKLNNVELLEKDVTGGLIEYVWKEIDRHSFFKRLKSLRNITIPEYKQDSDPGMIISLNIITQLESLLVEYLKKRSNITDDEILIFRTEIQKKHIDFLTKHRSVLITDCAEILTDRSGTLRTVPTLISDVPAGKYREEWVWNFDLKGADYYNSRSVMKVVAIII